VIITYWQRLLPWPNVNDKAVDVLLGHIISIEKQTTVVLAWGHVVSVDINPLLHLAKLSTHHIDVLQFV